MTAAGQTLPPPPSFEDVMHNLRNSAKTLCVIPGAAVSRIDGSSGARQSKYIATRDNFAGKSLDELHDKAQKIDSAKVDAASRTWDAASKQIEQLFTDFQNATSKAVVEHWQGQAADAVAEGVGNYVQSSDSLINAATAVSFKLNNLGTAVAQTKSAVPPPVGHSVTDNVLDWIPGPTWNSNKHEEDAAKGAALAALNGIYMPGLDGADAPPQMPMPHDPVAKSEPTVGGVNGGPPTAAGGGATGGGQATAPSGTQQEGGQQPGGDAGAADQGGAVAPGESGSGDSPAASPESARGTGEQTSAASADGRPSPHGGGGPGSGSGGSGGGGGGWAGGGAGSGMLASPVLGGVGGGAAETGGGSGAAGRTGPSAGRAGMPGMGMPGAKGKREDDTEHETPDWLKSRLNGEELLDRDGLRTLPPGGVIGVWPTRDGAEKP